jgi:hypothetical protein
MYAHMCGSIRVYEAAADQQNALPFIELYRAV